MDDQLQADAAGVSPASWDADPYGRHELRYWDGDGWTEHVSDNGVTATDKYEAPSPWSMMTEPAASAPTPVAVAAPVVPPRPVATAPPQPAAAPAPKDTVAPAIGGDWNALGPATMPVPAWSPPSQPPGGFNPTSFNQPPGKQPWHKRRSGRVLAVVGAALVLLFFGYLRFKPPDRIDAQPAAPTPAGFQVVNADEYQFAVPSSWRTQVLDESTLENLANQAEARAPGSGEAFKDALDRGTIEGTKTLAIDAVSGDNVNLIPFRALRGDPRDADNLAAIKDGFSAEHTGLNPTSLTAQAGDVHGFPAAVVRMTTSLNGQSLAMVSTIVQTGDRVFQLTVTSPSAQRAESLSAQIVPTFAPH